jgi:hypothetical protein
MREVITILNADFYTALFCAGAGCDWVVIA